MSMTVEYRNAIANRARSLITHIGLVNDQGAELSGGSPAYARLPVTWTEAADGVIRPTSDLIFNVGPHAFVSGWRGYSAATNGINYGGEALTPERYTGQGEYKLLAAGTGIAHRAV